MQAQSIPPALEGRDVVATAQTGTGKTLAFALPLVQRLAANPAPAAAPGARPAARVIILAPTRELAMQIGETIGKLTPGTGLAAAIVVGGMNEDRQLTSIRKGAQFIVATPGRLVDFIDRRLIKLTGVEAVVLDEADRMLDMGFLPSLDRILRELPAQRQTLLFSATIEKSVARLVETHVKNPVRVAIGSTTKPAELVDLHHYEVEPGNKLALLAHLLNAHPHGAFLVFTRTKHGADRLAKNLARTGANAARIHGDRTQGQRNQALKGFRDGTHRVLVATDVAARGIHVDDIAHVVNYDLPQAPEDFIHRVGRTGRAGARGTASTFSTREEREDIRRIERSLKLKLIATPLPDGLAAFALPVDTVHKGKVVIMPARTAAAAPRHQQQQRPRRRDRVRPR